MTASKLPERIAEMARANGTHGVDAVSYYLDDPATDVKSLVLRHVFED